MMEIEFTGVKIVENKGPGKDAYLIELHSTRKIRGKINKNPWKFGTFKARALLADYPNAVEKYIEWDANGRPNDFFMAFTLPGGYNQREDWTELRVLLFQHYLDEIKDYIDKNSTFKAPARQLIDEPAQIIVNDLYPEYFLLLPCYPKKDDDYGEGELGAWEINTWSAKMLTDKFHDVFNRCKDAVATGKYDNVILKYTNSKGEEKEWKLDEYQIRACVKYRVDILEYKASYV